MNTFEEPGDSCYGKLTEYQGVFINGLIYNFEKPLLYNEPPYQKALLGELIISTRNYIGKYEGFFLLYKFNGSDYIRIKIQSNNKKCRFTVKSTQEETIKISFDELGLMLSVDDFIRLLNENKFSLES